MKYLMSFLSFMEICEYRFDQGSGAYVPHGGKYSDFYTYFTEVYGLYSTLRPDFYLDSNKGDEGKFEFPSKTADEFVEWALSVTLTSLIEDLQCRSLAIRFYLCCLLRDHDSIDHILSAYFSCVAGRVRVSLLS